MMAAHNWRSLRERAASNGIGNLMELPTMHVVLDMIEQLGAEASTAGAKTQQEAKSSLDAYFDKLYKPDKITQRINGDGYLPPPPGFSDEEVEASFDAFLANPMR
ncbi:hypothetical protein I5G58_gp042 [Mycobacterium phage BirdsNest]|uniref:Uncharacterized protein n=1 Tax=Mycobacterium phage BirdsNest TaxID=2686231 RepID=A0A6B9LHN8_9CAUD|nr:hypothetical protein I5G58_gp042 [Mycobacterium phage BirdsNest]QHB37344.1 hypothetical protein PBI_BIRDSNEST_42 [Mycobacterium phage BirdsNest]